MFSRNEYDHGVNTFSPEGRIFQIEYARKAVHLGSTSIGIKTSEGIVLAAEKRVPSKLVDASYIKKIFAIDDNIATAVSGLTADASTLVEHARADAQNHRFTFNERAMVQAVTLGISDLALEFGEAGAKRQSRPYGVALLLGGIDTDGPQLWSTDPSGSFWSYDAHAIGSGAHEANNILTEKYSTSLNLSEAVCLAASILKQVVEEKTAADNIEISIIEINAQTFRALSLDEIQAVLDECSQQQ